MDNKKRELKNQKIKDRVLVLEKVVTQLHVNQQALIAALKSVTGTDKPAEVKGDPNQVKLTDEDQVNREE